MTLLSRVRWQPEGVGVIVEPCTSEHVRAASEVLARAFFDRQPFIWLLPDAELRMRALPVFFGTTLRYIHPFRRGAEVAVRDGRIIGAAIWAPPGRWRPSLLSELRAVPGTIRAVGLRNLGSFGERGQLINRALTASHPDEPHWYLVGLGVDPAAHGSGAGSALVRSGLERCRRDGAPAYLECLEELVPFYARLGFKVLARISMPDGTPDQFAMRWEAATASGPTQPSFST